MIDLPEGRVQLIRTANDLIEQCRVSTGVRASYYRNLNAMAQAGRDDNQRSKINLLHSHLARVAAHLFSPIYLRFTVEYDRPYPKAFLDRGIAVGKQLTRQWAKNGLATMFGRGVFESTKYGAAILKQWAQMDGNDVSYQKRLVMPWQFGVYREDENDINKQEVLCETTALTGPELWRRIYHLPDARKLYDRCMANASRGSYMDGANSVEHWVLSTSTLNTSGVQQASRPGGAVQIGNNYTYNIMGAQADVDMVQMHELWVKGETDYVTIQLIEPDILIAPLFKRSNLLIPGDSQSRAHPYTLIQPNESEGYFWGRSELVDLITPQKMLSQWADDIERLFGLQIDKILGFAGFDGLTDELYDQQREAGYVNAPPGATINDLTPKFPEQAIPMLKLIMEVMNQIGGFPPVMQGQGDAGVRAGSHADTLLKTASPSMRDRSLVVERQCASAADLSLLLRTAKDGDNYWTDGQDVETMEKTKFLLTDLPKDRSVAVDSHSSSPIFADDHEQLVAFGVKSGFVNGDYAIDALPYPEKDRLHAAYKEAQESKAKERADLLKRFPEEAGKAAVKSALG